MKRNIAFLREKYIFFFFQLRRFHWDESEFFFNYAYLTKKKKCV